MPTATDRRKPKNLRLELTPPSEFVSTQEAAQILGLHPETVREMLRRGDLVGRKTGSGAQNVWRVLRADVTKRGA
jgi:excisionase family DNA binding protein